MFVALKLKFGHKGQESEGFNIDRIERVGMVNAQETRIRYDIQTGVQEFRIDEPHEAVVEKINAAYERLATAGARRPAQLKRALEGKPAPAPR